MEFVLAVAAGAVFTVAVFLLLSRSAMRMVMGVAVLGNATALLILALGRLTRDVPPVVPEGFLRPEVATANPLPQALILIAIVTGFSVFATLLALAARAHDELGADDTGDMRLAEPDAPPRPPLSY